MTEKEMDEKGQGLFNRYMDSVIEYLSKRPTDEAFLRQVEDLATITDDVREQWRLEILDTAAKLVIRRQPLVWSLFTRLGGAIKSLVEATHHDEQKVQADDK